MSEPVLIALIGGGFSVVVGLLELMRRQNNRDHGENSRNSLTLNTGFVDQDYDETIKDILMSEYVAVLENNQWIAVQPERGSIEYQKHINQKLINYTLTFNYAFDERSLVR